jgi:hypothetical protein
MVGRQMLGESRGLDAALKMALDDADRVTTRDSETKREHEERRLNQLLAFLALLTTISVLQDFTQFVSGESPHAWEAGETLFRLFIFSSLHSLRGAL